LALSAGAQAGQEDALAPRSYRPDERVREGHCVVLSCACGVSISVCDAICAHQEGTKPLS
jgi:hypothetical protein